MPDVKKRRRRKNRSQKKFTCLFLIFGMPLLIGIIAFSGLLQHTTVPDNSGPPPHVDPLGQSRPDPTYDLVGVPTIDVASVNLVLTSYDSPAQGKGQALYDLGVQYGIDPIYALAFFMHESRFGTTGVAQVTLSLGNIRATPGYDSYDGYRKYQTWEEGFEDWYKLIKAQYVGKWQLSTVDRIIPVYAPGSDNNDVTAYIASIKQAVDDWRAGAVQI
jgi:hypothetical protein